jgi:hypothetical protein
MSLGQHSSRLCKILVTSGAAVSGASLGGAFGVQTGMTRLETMESTLGGELRILEESRGRLRKRGMTTEMFGGDAAEAERDKLTRATMELCSLCRDF